MFMVRLEELSASDVAVGVPARCRGTELMTFKGLFWLKWFHNLHNTLTAALGVCRQNALLLPGTYLLMGKSVYFLWTHLNFYFLLRYFKLAKEITERTASQIGTLGPSDNEVINDHVNVQIGFNGCPCGVLSWAALKQNIRCPVRREKAHVFTSLCLFPWNTMLDKGNGDSSQCPLPLVCEIENAFWLFPECFPQSNEHYVSLLLYCGRGRWLSSSLQIPVRNM